MCIWDLLVNSSSSHSVLNHLGLEPSPRVRREIETRQVPRLTCSNASDCWPDNDTPVPSTLIFCDSVIKECICNDCFFRNDTGRCEEDSCEDYFFRDNECVDDRPSQLTAFLLSLFLSSTGAANFYIGQDGLGKPFYRGRRFHIANRNTVATCCFDRIFLREGDRIPVAYRLKCIR